MLNLLTFTIVAVVCIGSGDAACQHANSIESEGTCFQYILTKANWTEAKEGCASLNMALAKVNSEAQLNAILQTDGEAWIGANDIDVENDFIWDYDTSPAKTDLESFRYWYVETGFMDGDCVVVYRISSKLVLYAFNCEHIYPYLCMEIS